MNCFTEKHTGKDGVLHADDIPLTRLAEEFGTPCYVYSAQGIRRAVTALQDALARALPAPRRPLIAYACKNNSNIAVIKLMQGLGLGTDIVSGGELIRSLKGGIPAGKIVFSGVGKTDEEIRLALTHGIRQINVESAPEAVRVAALAGEMNKTAPVAFRFTPAVDARAHAKTTTGKTDSKFGLLKDDLRATYKQALADPRLDVRGLSIHIGSQVTALDPFEDAFKALASFVRELRAESLPVPVLDLGGGLGIRYNNETPPDLDAYAALIRDIIAPLDTEIILEPGRVLVGTSGLLLARVLYIKESGGRRFAILDAGMGELMRPALYDAWHTVRAASPRPGPETAYDIAGPICESSDFFGKDRMMPPLQQGDLVAVMNGGAYGFVMASNYNTRPLPPEVLVDGDKTALIRPRQAIEDLIDGETVPEWI